MKYHQWPRKMTLKNYEDAKRTVLDIAREYDSFQTLWEIGSVSAPGISDLDLLVSLKDGEGFPLRKFLARLKRDVDPYIMIHEPIVLSETLVEKLETLYPIVVLKEVGAKTIERRFDEAKVARGALGFLNEYFLLKLPRDIEKAHYSKKTESARMMMVLLNSLRHSIKFLKKKGGREPFGWTDFEDELVAFREDQPTGGKGDESKLVDLIERGIVLGYGIIQETALLDDIVKVQSKLSGFPERVVFDAGLRAVFENDWSLEMIKGRLRAGELKGDLTYLPRGLLGYWCDVADSRTSYGDYIAGRLNYTALPGREAVIEGTQEHAEAIDDYLEFARKSLNFRGSYYLTLGAGDGSMVRFARKLKNKILR